MDGLGTQVSTWHRHCGFPGAGTALALPGMMRHPCLIPRGLQTPALLPLSLALTQFSHESKPDPRWLSDRAVTQPGLKCCPLHAYLNFTSEMQPPEEPAQFLLQTCSSHLEKNVTSFDNFVLQLQFNSSIPTARVFL